MITADCFDKPCVTDMQLLDVPDSVLIMILQHVPLQQRLGVCTCVCHVFQTAAVAATDSISIKVMRNQAQCDNTSEWLQLHGGGITCLDIQDGLEPSLACLPCPALKDLNLQGLALQPRFFSACTSLKRLTLSCCDLQSSQHASSSAAGDNPLSQLSVLCSLQHLERDNVRSTLLNPGCDEFPGSLLLQLVQLTCLKLRYDQVTSDAALQHLSALSALQHLELDLEGWRGQKPTVAALTGLQQLPQLTALKLFKAPWAINLHSMPAFTVLTALRVLQLDSPSVDPTVLETISQLQRAPRMLMAVLHCWQQLATLSAAAYSALTASSHLVLRGCGFPGGAWQQMFPPTRRLPAVRRLRVDTAMGQVQSLSKADVQAVVSCCPSLVKLKLEPQVPVSSATALQQLTGLTRLHLWASFYDSAPSIAQLTGLQDLVLNCSRQADQLTVLQQLRFIEVNAYEAAVDPGLQSSGMSYSCLRLSNEAPNGAPPDVWLQLKGLCEAAMAAD